MLNNLYAYVAHIGSLANGWTNGVRFILFDLKSPKVFINVSNYVYLLKREEWSFLGQVFCNGTPTIIWKN